jgi:hypothetical protein
VRAQVLGLGEALDREDATFAAIAGVSGSLRRAAIA